MKIYPHTKFQVIWTTQTEITEEEWNMASPCHTDLQKPRLFTVKTFLITKKYTIDVVEV